MSRPLMPKATAVWLVDNTSLTFEQIAEFCGLHALEVKGIADGEVAQGIQGLDPIANGQLSRAEIERCVGDANAFLQMAPQSVPVPEKRVTGPRYTPVSKRQDRPNAIAWLIRYHPELTDAQISRLVGTTKPTITAIRERTHWNISNITPQDPVTLGLSSQVDLDGAVQKAREREQRLQDRENKVAEGARAAQLEAATAAGLPSTQLETEASAASDPGPVAEPPVYAKIERPAPPAPPPPPEPESRPDPPAEEEPTIESVFGESEDERKTD